MQDAAERNQTDYLATLCEGISKLLNEIVSDGSSSLFRKTPQVVLTQAAQGSTDLHLSLIKKTMSDTEKGTFTSPFGENGFMVFRNPVRLKATFSLVGTAITNASSLRAMDQLMGYFFDHRTLEPILPKSFSKYPKLFEKMASQKAELRMTEADASQTQSQGFFFTFEYLALYHSGNPLREELKTKTRIIDFDSMNERTVT